MNTEQLRAEFEAWHKREMWDGGYESGHDEFCPDAYRFNERRVYENIHMQIAWRGYQAGRAALQSQAQIPAPTNRDEYIALLDRAIDMGKQLNVMWEEAFAEVGIKHGLQTQDREDALRYRHLRDEGGLDPHDIFNAWWLADNGNPQTLDEAIDHARRIES